MQCQSVFTHITDEYLAVDRLRSDLRQEHLSYIICYYTEEYDFRAIHSAFLRYFPGVPFHG
ncbi:hypothetical protein CGK27_24080, partial [Vibrio parahaemolyticus]